jgi:hypothetical protein
MDAGDLERDATLAAVMDLLRSERPALTFDEIQRLDRRLEASGGGRAQRRGSRLLASICVAFGMLFMTAGTGLAIGGLGTPGTADRAQYPDSGGSPPTSSAPATSAGGVEGAEARRDTPSRPSTLGDIRQTDRGTTTALRLRQAETRGDLPFTGFAVIPILLAGIVLLGTGVAVNRRARRSA